MTHFLLFLTNTVVVFIIFGIDEASNYEIVGVYDPQDLQKKVTEQCKQALQKKVDILNREQLHDNPELINEILKDGIKIYG